MSHDADNELKKVVVIGAGPAGLTAAYELVTRSGIKPLVLEASDQVGGISKTIEHHGNRMDLGGHRFFSKSDWVMNWWAKMLPVAAVEGAASVNITYHGKSRAVSPALNTTFDACMLVRPRLSRIYFLRKFFDYPVKLNWTTIKNLGVVRLIFIMVSYLKAKMNPRAEKSLEDFVINRFGVRLYEMFFKDYTEKVWGVPCSDISPEWGAQRIKGLSASEALKHAVQACLGGNKKTKEKHTSLIEKFLYPPLGPGQMWETVAAKIKEAGGEIEFDVKVVSLLRDGTRIHGVEVERKDGGREVIDADVVISTMPVKDLISGMNPGAPLEIQKVAGNLPYRDFMTLGLLVRKLTPSAYAKAGSPTHLLPDNWIYIQEKEVRLGRLQIFNNWSANLVADDANTVWLGLEYFCNEGDHLWEMSDDEFSNFAIQELESIDLIRKEDVLDWRVVRVEKAYPAYFGAYAEFGTVRKWVDKFDNLYLVGRNGMHRYNNQDHSMLTGKMAAEDILNGGISRDEIWAINVDDEYHEVKV